LQSDISLETAEVAQSEHETNSNEGSMADNFSYLGDKEESIHLIASAPDVSINFRKMCKSQ